MADAPSTGCSRPAFGAYGLRIEGLDGATDLLLAAPAGWPLLTVQWVEELSPPAPHSGAEESTIKFGDEVAVVDHGTIGTIEVRRAPAVATFRIRAARDPSALVHPYLGGAASIVSRWLGREVFHGGAFVHCSGAWVVLGDRTAGKSSLLAWLHANGFPILADDVVVVDGGVVYPAPRSLDLRRESAEQLGLGAALGRVGARDRWRVVLGPVPLEVPLAGFVFLGWSEGDPAVSPVSGHRRFTRLAAALTMPNKPASAAALLGLAGLPCLELRRRRDWIASDAAGRALLAALDS